MKNVAALLAAVSVLLSLIGLLVADYQRDNTSAVVFVHDNGSISDIRDRLVLRNSSQQHSSRW
jgi:hypothetical protein